MAQAINLQIDTERVVFRGEKFRRILGFSGYDIDDLPLKYFKELPFCFVDEKEFVVAYSQGDSITFKVKELVSEKDFRRAIRTIRFTGHKLHEIMKDVKELKKEWNGKESFEIWKDIESDEPKPARNQSKKKAKVVKEESNVG